MAIRTADIPQLNEMRLGVDYFFTVTLRRFKLRVRPLSISENVQVVGNVSETLARVPENLRSRLTENSLIAKETLKLASTSDVGANDAQITDLVMDHMTPDELQVLFKQYVAHCDRVNPELEKMDPADLDALIDALKKSAPDPEVLALRLTELSVSQLHNLALSLLTRGD